MRKILCTLLCLLLLALGGTALAEEMPQGLWMIPDYSGAGSPFNYVSIEVKENSDLQLWDKHWDVEDAPEARLPREGEMARRWYGGAMVREPQSGPKLTDFYIRDHDDTWFPLWGTFEMVYLTQPGGAPESLAPDLMWAKYVEGPNMLVPGCPEVMLVREDRQAVMRERLQQLMDTLAGTWRGDQGETVRVERVTDGPGSMQKPPGRVDGRTVLTGYVLDVPGVADVMVTGKKGETPLQVLHLEWVQVDGKRFLVIGDKRYQKV